MKDWDDDTVVIALIFLMMCFVSFLTVAGHLLETWMEK